MKQGEQLSALSTEALKQKASKLKGMVIGLSVAWGILLAVAIAVAVYKGTDDTMVLLPLFMTPVLFITTFLPVLSQWKKVKTEIESRKKV